MGRPWSFLVEGKMVGSGQQKLRSDGAVAPTLEITSRMETAIDDTRIDVIGAPEGAFHATHDLPWKEQLRTKIIAAFSLA